MRRLILLRHAHAPQVLHDDHDRPLDERGAREACRVGADLAARGWAPDAVVTSDARRTLDTWRLLSGALPPAERPVYPLRGLYTRGAAAAIEAFGQLDLDAASTVLLLGHNPEWERLIAWLTREPVALEPAHGVLAASDGPATWAEAVRPGGMRAVARIRP